MATPYLRIPRLDDGEEPVHFHFCDLHPTERVLHWASGMVDCTGEGCELCAEGVRPLFYAEWTISTPEGNRILRAVPRLAKAIEDVGIVLGAQYVLWRTGRTWYTQFHFDLGPAWRSN